MIISRKWFNKLFIISAILLIIAAPNQYSIEIMPKTFLSAADVISLITFFFLLLSDFRIYLPKVARKMPIGIIFLLLWMCISIINAEKKLKAAKEIIQSIEYFVVIYSLFACSWQNSFLRKYFFKSAWIIASVILLSALAQYAMPHIDSFHVRGTFGNNNVLGGFLSLTAPTIFAFMIHATQKRIFVLSFLGLLACLFLAMHGGALAGIIISIILIAYFKNRRIGFLTVLLLIIGISLCVPFFPRSNTKIMADSLSIFDNDGVPTQRYTEWQAGIFMIAENPVLGVGAGNYQNNIGMYYGYLPSPEHASEPDSQNLYIVLASSCGIPALIFFLAFMIEVICRLLYRYFYSANAIFISAAGGIIAFLIACIWSPLLVRGIGPSLAFLLSLHAIPLSDDIPTKPL